MRNWQITADSPQTLRFAADARLGYTDYKDDQIWELELGGRTGGRESALAFKTTYGGRASLVRLIPTFLVEQQVRSVSQQPTLVAFAPNYAQIELVLSPNLMINAELWVMESNTVGGRFTWHNQGDMPVSVGLELAAEVLRTSGPPKMEMQPASDGSAVVLLGELNKLYPAVMLENVLYTKQPLSMLPQQVSPKLAYQLVVPAKASRSLRWVHSATATRKESIQAAHFALNKRDWERDIAEVDNLANGLLSIETGDPDLDITLGMSINVLLRSVINPKDSALPYPTLVSSRIPSRGLAPHGWQWNGQSVYLGYLALPSLAFLFPRLAVGIYRNWLTSVRDDGWIEARPGAGKERSNLMCPPLLATIGYTLYQITESKTLLSQIYPLLIRYFQGWFNLSLDADSDGYPEWTSVVQTGYDFNPTFARNLRWAQNVDIRQAETPEMGAYLINEAHMLLNMADVLGQRAAADDIVTPLLKSLQDGLARMWDAQQGVFHYVDRDTHQVVTGQQLYRGKGDQVFDNTITLQPANRLILRIVGGLDFSPKVSVTIEGIGVDGKAVEETLFHQDFNWVFGLGLVVSQHIYSQVKRVKFNGLSGVFKVEVDTVDLSKLYLSQLLPLWAGAATKQQFARIVETLTNPVLFWHQFGLPICPPTDPNYQANNENGSGGAWGFWNTVMVEGLIRTGYHQEATTLFRRMLDTHIKALRQQHGFFDPYNSENGQGIGDPDALGGLPSLALFMRIIGLRPINRYRVWAGGLFAFTQPITVKWRGLTITRSAQNTVVVFPGGYTVTVDGTWQLIEDVEAAAKAATSSTGRRTPTSTKVSQTGPLRPHLKQKIKTQTVAKPTTQSLDPKAIPVVTKRDATQEVPYQISDEDTREDDQS